MQDIVTEFFTQKYEKKINKDILYYDFPKEEVTAYVEQVINEPVDRFVAYIKGLTAKSRIETGDVIQFSNIEDATINFCEKVNEVNNPGLNFQEIGRLLQDDGIERKVGAYVKYGENHTKTAQTLGLAFELCNTYYLSGVGYIFIELNEEDRKKLLTRMILRSKLFTRMMQASVNGKVNMREFLYMLSDSTYVRRRSNVKKMMGYLIQSDEYDFTEFIDIIEL